MTQVQQQMQALEQVENKTSLLSIFPSHDLLLHEPDCLGCPSLSSNPEASDETRLKHRELQTISISRQVKSLREVCVYICLSLSALNMENHSECAKQGSSPLRSPKVVTTPSGSNLSLCVGSSWFLSLWLHYDYYKSGSSVPGCAMNDRNGIWLRKWLEHHAAHLICGEHVERSAEHWHISQNLGSNVSTQSSTNLCSSRETCAGSVLQCPAMSNIPFCLPDITIRHQTDSYCMFLVNVQE